MTDHGSVLYDAQEYLVAGGANQAEWWEHLGDAHRDYAALARVAVAQQVENTRLREALRKIMEGSEAVRHEGLVEATELVLVEKNSTRPRVDLSKPKVVPGKPRFEL